MIISTIHIESIYAEFGILTRLIS